MRNTLITAPLTTRALAELEAEFRWALIPLPVGSEIGSTAGEEAYDPASVVAVVIEGERLDAVTMDLLPSLSLVACLRGNPVNVDIEHATARCIPVLHTPGRNAESVADLVIGLIYSCIRHIARTHHLIVSRELTEEHDEERQRADVVWLPSTPAKPIPYLEFKGPEISQLSLSLLGFGAIGQRVARKALAIGMRVLACDPFVSDEQIRSVGAEPVAFDQLFVECDVLSLHVPPQGTKPLVGASELALMKPTAYVINTARASVLDYKALVAALREERLGGAGLDVFPDEPLSARSPLLELPNVTLTPHIAGASTGVVEHQSELLLSSLRALALGDPSSATLKNPEVLAKVPFGIPAALRKLED